jgi:[pyruvate, water dikinase]-phosphate phosphotransferase / [pyruvate, water dikinase] kinase
MTQAIAFFRKPGSEGKMPQSHTIIIVSGGAGASGEQLVHTLLAQFPENRAEVITVSNVRFENQISEAVARAQATGAILVHTMVDEHLRTFLVDLAASQGIVAFDLAGPLLNHMAQVFDQAPAGQPGLYRRLNKAYFDRVGAIEYSLAHDDGQKPDTWAQADVLLLGVSRSGKTPLSLYLSVLGWHVANLPLVIGLDAPAELYQLNRQRVIGLKIEAGQLLAFRRQRQRRLGVSGPSSYTNLDNIYEELQYAERVYRQGGFLTLDVTDKPIETTADEIIRLISSHALQQGQE